MVVALLADARNPLPENRQGAIAVRLLECLQELRTSELPSVEGWRDLTDAMNWLQSCKEQGWIDDAAESIEDAKAALLQAHDNHRRHGKLRTDAAGLEALRTMIENVKDMLAQVTAQQYWSAVKVTEKRLRNIHAGQVRPGDTVVQL